jgi:hypothetical protein
LLGYIGDRTNRVKLSSVAAAVYGAMAVLTGLAPFLAVLAIARVIGGIGFLSSETVYPSLLSDYYPPERLGGVFGAFRLGANGLALVGAGLAQKGQRAQDEHEGGQGEDHKRGPPEAPPKDWRRTTRSTPRSARASAGSERSARCGAHGARRFSSVPARSRLPPCSATSSKTCTTRATPHEAV